jgi:hypothetical protein
MSSTPGSAATDGPVVAAPGRRAPMALVTYAFIVLVLLIVAVLLVVKVTRGATTVVAPPVTRATAAVVHDAATVAPVVFDTVGAPAVVGPEATVLSGQSALVVAGHPAVVFVGSEFSPYCAAARWALVVALSRFGTFGHLGATSSSIYETFPRIATFSFEGSTYRSAHVTFSAVEQYGQVLATRAPAGFKTLGHPTALTASLVKKFGAGPGPTLPFIDIGNRVVMEGAGIGFSPGVLQGLSMNQIATDLSVPTSPVAQSVVGAANQITAAICSATAGKPGTVCQSPGVRAGANRLGR